jgi:uncharacterized SAM-binding protein YcdF (DUF218 family)
MYVSLSKSLGNLASPATILAICVVANALAAVSGHTGAAAIFLALSTTVVVLFGILPAADWVTLPLEARFPANPALPDRIAGIVVLGGMERLEQSLVWAQPAVSDPGPIAALVELGRRHPEARLVFTGGGRNQRITEAAVACDFLSRIGADYRAVTYEDQSRNTLENARLTHDLIRPNSDERWVLVCQAAGMPRAMGVFRKAGWNVIAYPAGYLTRGNARKLLPFDLLEGLRVGSVGLHEWVGLGTYRLMGYIDEILPR